MDGGQSLGYLTKKANVLKHLNAFPSVMEVSLTVGLVLRLSVGRDLALVFPGEGNDLVSDVDWDSVVTTIAVSCALAALLPEQNIIPTDSHQNQRCFFS